MLARFLIAAGLLALGLFYYLGFDSSPESAAPVDTAISTHSAESGDSGAADLGRSGEDLAVVSAEPTREPESGEDAAENAAGVEVPPGSEGEDVPAPTVPGGTALTGILVDANGAPVPKAAVQIKQPEKQQTLRVTADAEGRFAAAVELIGEVTLIVREEGVGRSLDRTLFLGEGQATDAGEIQLLGSGMLRGRVIFSSGEAFPRVDFGAEAVDPSASPGLTRAGGKTDDGGSFALEALAPGPFSFEVFGEEALPIVGRDTFQSGDGAVEIAVNAALLQISAVDAAGAVVGMREIELASVPSGEQGTDSNYGSTNLGFAEDVAMYEFFVATNLPYLLQASDAEGGTYFAYLDGGLSAGIHSVELSADHPAFGGLQLRVEGAATDAPLTLGVRRLYRNGDDVAATVLVSGDVSSGQLLEVKGLLPGEYRAQFVLEGAEYMALEEGAHEFKIVAGAVETIPLQVFSGGRISLKVKPAVESADLDANARGLVELRRRGSPDWVRAELVSKRKRSTVRGSRVFLGGTPGLSSVLAPGVYELRVTSEGYATQVVEVVVSEGGTAEVDVRLR